jgi:inhibitor of cysteine peptidase
MNHTGIIMGLSLLCILALAVAGCTGSGPSDTSTTAATPSGTAVPDTSVYITEAQNGATVDMKVGQILVVSLPENGTTGYLWNLTVSPGLQVLSDTFVSSDKTGTMAGAGGTHTWNIRVDKPGNQWVKGVYSRSWEPLTGDERTLKVMIVASA